MPRAVGLGRAKHFPQSCPFLCPGGAGARAVWARGGRVTVRRRTRRFGHAALPPCSVFAPRRTTRRQCRVWLGRHRAAGRAKRARAPPCPTGLRRSPVLPTQCASERTLFFVLKSVRDAACGGEKPGEAFLSKLPFSLPGRRGGQGVLCRAAASLSAAARGVSDTLHSHRAACSLRGALRGGSAAAGSAGIGRRVGRNGGAAPPSSRARPGSTGAPPFVCIRSDAACEGACPRADAKKAASLSEAQTAPPPAFMKNLSKS